MPLPSALHIRPATPADTELIITLIRELAVYEKMEDSVSASPDELFRNLFGDRPYAEVIIAEWERTPAGFALFFHNFSTFMGKPGLYLEDIFVREEFRGKGIGKALMLELVRIALERNCGRMEWSVLNWNPARKFYERMGATAMDEWVVYRLTEEKMKRLGWQDQEK